MGRWFQFESGIRKREPGPRPWLLCLAHGSDFTEEPTMEVSQRSYRRMGWESLVKPCDDAQPFGSWTRLDAGPRRLGSRELRACYRPHLHPFPRENNAALGRGRGAITGRPEGVCDAGSRSGQVKLNRRKAVGVRV